MKTDEIERCIQVVDGDRVFAITSEARAELFTLKTGCERLARIRKIIAYAVYELSLDVSLMDVLNFIDGKSSHIEAEYITATEATHDTENGSD